MTRNAAPSSARASTKRNQSRARPRDSTAARAHPPPAIAERAPRAREARCPGSAMPPLRRLRRMLPTVRTLRLLQVRLINKGGRPVFVCWRVLTGTQHSCRGCEDQGPARCAQGHPTCRRSPHPLRLHRCRRCCWPTGRHHQRRDVHCRRRLHQRHRSQRPAQPIHLDQGVHSENGKYFVWSTPADTGKDNAQLLLPQYYISSSVYGEIKSGLHWKLE